MESMPIAASPLSQEDLAALRRAKEALESPSFTMKLASVVGSPIEKMMAKMPNIAQEKVDEATQAALKKCLQLALRTLSKSTIDGVVLPPEKPHNLIHKLAVATTGAAGGAFGLFALPIELPVTTTLMFRSICDIARSEGEDVHLIDTQLQCLMVLGMGGPSSSDDSADIGYFFIVRGTLAQSVSKATSELAAKDLSGHGSTALLKFLQTVASRFSVQVSEQVAAKSIPAIGAVLGAMVNTIFIDHFQQTAHGHFTVRRLERQYGQLAVEHASQTINITSRK
ncbi:MAG: STAPHYLOLYTIC protease PREPROENZYME LASA [uncultured Caballeronia sp.]|nr:MAG: STAPHYLOLYTIC protease PREPROENZYME LASA [uncultured Caballeronia sp.]